MSYFYNVGYKLFLNGTSELSQYYIDLLFTKNWEKLGHYKDVC